MAKASVSKDQFTFLHQRAAARFWTYVDITANPDECWEWTASSFPHNYGCFWFNGSNWRTHRLAYFLTTGIYPAQCILHSCDNPPCCNPNHLREDTQAENLREARTRGRRWKVLRPADVINIRAQFATGVAKKALARQFHVDPSLIRRIINNTSWRSVK